MTSPEQSEVANSLAVSLCEHFEGHSDLAELPADRENEYRSVAKRLVAEGWTRPDARPLNAIPHRPTCPECGHKAGYSAAWREYYCTRGHYFVLDAGAVAMAKRQAAAKLPGPTA